MSRPEVGVLVTMTTLPKTLRGKTLRGSVTVAYGGAIAKRTFAVRIS
jgi:hypothetical protein